MANLHQSVSHIKTRWGSTKCHAYLNGRRNDHEDNEVETILRSKVKETTANLRQNVSHIKIRWGGIKCLAYLNGGRRDLEDNQMETVLRKQDRSPWQN